ncbi:MAG: DUF2891 domain-containing protein [Deltaproteobacteria bacterium]|nr:MAG: DUF2891 domain-containing protein [Deltaproteobacteria bacterium]
MTGRLDASTADRLAALILPSLHREYPNHISHVLQDDADVRPPRELTPAFFGCYDWHSAVHSHWAIARLVRRFPAAAWADRARAALDRSFAPDRIRGEVAYLRARPGFEMPYGMAWLLTLCAEATPWRSALAPLERIARDRFAAWLDRLSHPIRSGEHTNSAFAMALALDYARAAGDRTLADAIVARAVDFYADDPPAPVAFEPSAYDFLSPSLAEADLMRRVLPPAAFASWLAAFLPSVDRFEPVSPVDRADGKLAHFDGLNLSRAWMLRALGFFAAAERHARAGLRGVSPDHYAGAHWLGTFALYWYTAPS